MIRLHYNEFPSLYEHSPKVKKVIRDFDFSGLSPYPEAQPAPLVNSLASHLGVLPDNLLLTCGSDEGLYLIFKAFFQKGKILRPEITYAYYENLARSLGFKFTDAPLNEDLSIDIKKFVGTTGIVVANPNAPTGKALNLEEIVMLLEQNSDAIVLIDEAYIEYSSVESAITLIDKYPNLIVTQTFSKAYPLANIRVGYIIASTEIIKTLRKLKDDTSILSVTTLSHDIALAALSDYQHYKKLRKEIIKTRKWVARKLGCQDTHTNFIFVEVSNADAALEKLNANGFLVRNIKNPNRIQNYLRIAIGTRQQMEDVVKCLKKMK